MEAKIILPQTIGDGRLDTLIKAFSHAGSQSVLHLDWSRVEVITPAGLAIAACLFDRVVEQRCKLRCLHVPKFAQQYGPVKNLLAVKNFSQLPNPDIHNFKNRDLLLEGKQTEIDLTFPNQVEELFRQKAQEEKLDAARLIINELMMNSVDHAGAERYYLYAGLSGDELHLGVLDSGVTIPAKLEQKYRREDDIGYLLESMERGITTRRMRIGGMGLYYLVELLKENEGRLTILSRRGSVQRYFKRRKTETASLKNSVPGTWCFARLRIK